MSHPICASTLLDLEGSYPPHLGIESRLNLPLPVVSQMGISLQGLDLRLARLWSGGQVVGVASVDLGEELGKTSLSIHVLSATLLTAMPTDPNQTASPPAPLDIYIIAPHTAQTIPKLHAHLANTIGSSQSAIELLNSVQLLQYFDFAGLAESVAEVGESVYRKAREQKQAGNTTDRPSASLALIQGLLPATSTVHRRNGLIQANALLADLIRNITQLSRSNQVPVMVELATDVEDAPEMQHPQEITSQKKSRSMELNSAFSGPDGQTLRLNCGHQSLSMILEFGLDGLIAVHDGLGRIEKRKQPREQVVEVLKDRRGNLTGFWQIWKEP